ncbi:MAG: lipopolysaccharide kinase InaA family protein [Planctomycetes bacterium]|nr:lipopolysaccharide kinase InaA family protein [Planctomycetota bacterium]
MEKPLIIASVRFRNHYSCGDPPTEFFALFERLKLGGFQPSEGFEIVKSNRVRTLWRIESPTCAYYLKHFHRRSFFEKVKKLFGMTQAEREFDNDVRFSAATLMKPITVALGVSLENSDSFLASQEVEDTVPALEFVRGFTLEKDPKTLHKKKRALLRGLAETTFRFHKANLMHRDYHLGNILVRERDFQPVILDFQKTISIPVHVGMMSLVDLAHLAFSMRKFFTRADIYFLLRTYLEIAGIKNLRRGTRLLYKRIHRRMKRLEARRFRSRKSRCFKNGSDFGVEKREGATRIFSREFGSEALESVRRGAESGFDFEEISISEGRKKWQELWTEHLRGVATRRMVMFSEDGSLATIVTKRMTSEEIEIQEPLL